MRLPWSVAEIVDVMLGVQHHRDHLVPAKTQKYAEMIAGSRLDFRPLHIWSVIHRVFVVIFQRSENVVERGSWNEHHAGPVMNNSSRAGDRLPIFLQFQLLHFHFAAL